MTVYNELVKNTSVILSDYGVKISDIGKVSSIIGLATTAYITVAENNIPNVSELFRKRDIETRDKETKKHKCFTTFGCNKCTNNMLDAKIKNEIVVNDSDISGL